MKATSTPRYYDIEQYRRTGSRKQWAAIAILACTTLASSGISFALAIKPAPVIAFDSQGKPILFEDTYAPATRTDRVRVDWFAQYFLEKFVAIDSSRLDRDLADALNLMTPRMREIELKDGAEIARRRQYRDGNVRSHLEQLEIRIGDFDPNDLSQPIYLYAWGQHVFEPLLGKVDNDSKTVRFVFFKMMLTREPVAKEIPHGLLISHFEWYSFETQDELDTELLKIRRK